MNVRFLSMSLALLGLLLVPQPLSAQMPEKGKVVHFDFMKRTILINVADRLEQYAFTDATRILGVAGSNLTEKLQSLEIRKVFQPGFDLRVTVDGGLVYIRVGTLQRSDVVLIFPRQVGEDP